MFSIVFMCSLFSFQTERIVRELCSSSGKYKPNFRHFDHKIDTLYEFENYS